MIREIATGLFATDADDLKTADVAGSGGKVRCFCPLCEMRGHRSATLMVDIVKGVGICSRCGARFKVEHQGRNAAGTMHGLHSIGEIITRNILKNKK